MSQFKTDRAYTWFNSPVYMYVQSLDATFGGGVSAAGDLWLDWYWHDNGQFLTQLWHPNIEQDDHDNPGTVLLSSSSGTHPNKLLAAYSQHTYTGHTSTHSYSRSTLSKNGIDVLGTENTIGAAQTYANIFQLNTTGRHVYWFFRNGGTGAGNTAIRVSTDDGDTWGADTDIVDGATKGPYFIIYHDSANRRFDFAITTDNPNSTVSSVYHMYMTYDSSGNRSWFKTDGTQIGTGDSALPIPLSSMTLVYNGATTNAWISDICYCQGTLTIGVITWDSNSTTTPGSGYYSRSTWNGSSWSALEQISNAGGTGDDRTHTAEPHYTGLFSFDPLNANRVIASRKYGAGDFRLEEYTKSGGVWSKTTDISGNTSSFNFRPMRVRDREVYSLATQWTYLRGTYTSSQSYSLDLYSYPDLTVNTGFTALRVKPTSPAWQSGSAPVGCVGYWPFTDGTGTVVTDFFTTPHNGALVSTPTWATADYGPEMNGFATTKYVTMDAASGLVYNGTYPCSMTVHFRNTNTADAVLFSLGSSSSTTPVAALRINDSGVVGTVSALLRDNSGGGPVSLLTGTGFPCNDGNAHTITLLSTAANKHYLMFDGRRVKENTTSLGTLTCNQLTVGALRRNVTPTLPCNGSVIAAMICSGTEVQDPGYQSHDWLTGQYEAIRPPVTTAGTGAILPSGLGYMGLGLTKAVLPSGLGYMG